MVLCGVIVVQSRVRVKFMDYLPNIENRILLSSPLHTVELEMLQAIPVITAIGERGGDNFPGEIFVCL